MREGYNRAVFVFFLCVIVLATIVIIFDMPYIQQFSDLPTATVTNYDIKKLTNEQIFPSAEPKWKFGLNVGAELSMKGEAMEAQGYLFTEYVLKTLKDIRERRSKASKCAYNNPSRKLKEHQYSHMADVHDNKWIWISRNTTFEMYQIVSDVIRETEQGDNSTAGFVWHFSPALPAVLNHFPNYSAQDSAFNISRPFGGWHAVFYPIDNFRVHNQETPLTAYFRSPQLLEPTPPLFAAVIPNGVSSGGYAITCSGHVLPPGGCLWEFQSPHRQAIKFRKQIVIPLCDSWCFGYYHFTHEQLPRLALVHDLLTKRHSPAVLALAIPPSRFVMSFIVDVLGIPSRRIVWKPNTISGDLLVYPMPQMCSNTSTHVLYMIRHLVQKRLNLSLMYIPRSYSAVTRAHSGMEALTSKIPRIRILFAERPKLSRMPDNYYELKERLLGDLGDRVEVYTTMGETGVVNQVKRFYAADLVIGPHGANLANIMW
eukprot:Tbor_TRINITY_DN5578_c0_g2::TRINITY_DN5578_c0_g2_i1::g.13684::m.13684